MGGRHLKLQPELLVEIVKGYAREMNALEREFSDLGSVSPEMWEAFRRQYSEIFERYCTARKRVYGGKGVTFGSPPKFDGAERPVEASVVEVSSRRAEVYIRTNNEFRAEYLFVVVQRHGCWRIDNARYRWFDASKWKTSIL